MPGDLVSLHEIKYVAIYILPSEFLGCAVDVCGTFKSGHEM